MSTPSEYRGGKSAHEIQERYHVDQVAKLSSNENPLPTSPAVLEALQAALPELNRYPDWDDGALRNGLAAHVGRQTTPEHFITGNGGCDILFMIARAYLQPGAEAIICPPTFPVYEASIRRQGATPVSVPLLDHTTLDVDGILAAVGPNTRLLYLCSPNNPTGSIITQSQLDRLMAALPEQVTVVADEVYHHFNTAPEWADSFPHLQESRRLIIVHSFSKVFGLAGLRLGYGIADPGLIARLSALKLPFHINQLTVTAGLAAMADRDHVEESVSLILAERDLMIRELQQMAGVTVWPSQANFVLIRSRLPGPDLTEQMAQRGVMVRELGNFYMPDFVRVTLGLPSENRRFRTALAEILAG